MKLGEEWEEWEEWERWEEWEAEGNTIFGKRSFIYASGESVLDKRTIIVEFSTRQVDALINTPTFALW